MSDRLAVMRHPISGGDETPERWRKSATRKLIPAHEAGGHEFSKRVTISQRIKKSPAIGGGASWPRHAEDGKRAPEASAWSLGLTGRFAFFLDLHCSRAPGAIASLADHSATGPSNEAGESDLSAAPAIW
jgi:hypothetical protein